MKKNAVEFYLKLDSKYNNLNTEIFDHFNKNINMNKKTILLLITILVFSVMFGVMWSYFKFSDEGTRFVRKNANSVEAQSDMEAMNKALTIMREKK